MPIMAWQPDGSQYDTDSRFGSLVKLSAYSSLALMIHSYFLAFIFVLVSNQFCANADLTHNHCHVTVNDDKFDLSSLAGEQVVSRTHETPPTIMVDSLRFNVCADLKYQTELPEQDQVCSP